MPKKLNTPEIIRRAINIHSGKYDYSLVEYVNDATKIKIICNNHGIFEQRPGSHIRLKHGCPKCASERIGERCRNQTDKVIADIEGVWGKNSFDFTKMNYIGAHSKIKLKCLKHNMWFDQYPGAVFKKMIGCVHCIINSRNNKQDNKHRDEFIKISKSIHANLYDYSKVKYVNQETPVIIICKIHGEFLQKPANHKAGCGCQKCNYSKGEHSVAKTLDKFNVHYLSQFNVKIGKRRAIFDFCLPDNQIMIEYNGSQHYSPSKWSHKMSDIEVLKLFEIQQYKDELKRIYCAEHNFKLIEIPYTDFKRIPEIIETHLNLL